LHAHTTRLVTPSAVRHADHPDQLGLFPGVPVAWKTCTQVHGAEVAVVGADSPAVTAEVDALCTDEPGVALGISVADCCAVYIADPVRRVIGLAHSGRKGSEQNIAGQVISLMVNRWGSRPCDLVVQLGPCIRPPHYEVDFATMIREQVACAGVVHLHDCGICTASDLSRYYSYRAEKGQTGRMMAALCLHSD